MIDDLHPPKVFISAVTPEFGNPEFGDVRTRLADVFESHGADVVVQRDHPSRLSGGSAIASEIKSSDLAVYLIGNRYGTPLPPGNLPAGVPAWYSWTEWECHLRKTARDYLLFFYNGPPIGQPEPEQYAKRQTDFRDLITAEEKGSIDTGKFRYWFKTPEELEKCLVKYLEDRNGALTRFRAGTWAKIRANYRRKAVDGFAEHFPAVYRSKRETSRGEKKKLMAADKPPFIASQRFSILEPKGGKQLHALKPAAFLPGRSTEIEAIAREDSTWNPVPRETLKQALRDGKSGPIELGGVKIPSPLRLFLVSGGGVGKTTNMRWLDATLNGSDDADKPSARSAGRNGDKVRKSGGAKTGAAKAPSFAAEDPAGILAIRVDAGTLLNLDDDGVLKQLTSRVAIRADVPTGADVPGSKWSLDAIAEGLRQDALAQRLVFLVDGLDHVETGKVPFFLSIQTPGRPWYGCSVVAAGRPHAIQGWREDGEASEHAVAISRWRFLEPSEFEPDEAEVFLGITEGKSRYGLVAYQLGSLAQLPRVLEYVRRLSEKQLEGVRTSADIYQRALRELIKRTLPAGSKETRMIGPNWKEDCERKEPTAQQVDYVMKFLSVLSFLSLCPTTDAGFDDAGEGAPRSEAFMMTISDDIRRFMCKRLVETGQPPQDMENLSRDFRALSGFASFVGNGVLDATDSDAENFNSLVWSNRTIQQFLAAYWYARHADGFEVLEQRLAGKAIDIRADDPRRDTERLRHYVFYPEDAGGDTTYELNMFLAEMPPSTPLSPSSWVASASAWYDPDLNRRPGALATRKWSTEMLYRSWATMHDIAGYPYDDWWDLPYQSLVGNAPGWARAKASLHQQRDRAGLNANSAAQEAARAVLAGFRADFGNILKGARGAAPQTAAQEMIEDKNWLSVPDGRFKMGAPRDKQGFPPKVKAYWVRDLDDVQTGRMTPDAVARRSTKTEWFTGAQGKQLREGDILWLSEAFSVAEPAPGAKRLARPKRDAAAYRRALQILEDKWSRRDETPAENPQQVATFVMHRLPVLHRWYHLFAPGYRATVAKYLQPRPYPPDNHPAIYVSWFDAWAFCQWANWTVEDPTAEGGRRRYGLRLPHEAEWEYAVRWATNGSGQAEPVAYGQRYWWGDTFYDHEDLDDPLSAKPERKSNKNAHAKGAPGETRAPDDAAPNGLGFHDILGNVWEWAANVYETRREGEDRGDDVVKYSRARPSERPPVNCLRTMRGGLWYYLDLLANCTARFRLASDDRDYKMGFRVVREERVP
jgi:formylglycine-generating enzyme required for sulfatase activity